MVMPCCRSGFTPRLEQGFPLASLEIFSGSVRSPSAHRRIYRVGARRSPATKASN